MATVPPPATLTTGLERHTPAGPAALRRGGSVAILQTSGVASRRS